MSSCFLLEILVIFALIGMIGEASAEGISYPSDYLRFTGYIDIYNNTLEIIGIKYNNYDGYITALENVMQQNNNIKNSAAHVENDVLYIDILAYDSGREMGRDLITLAFAGFVQAVEQTSTNALVFTRLGDYDNTICTFHANRALAQDALNNQNNSTKIALDIEKFESTCQCKGMAATATGNYIGNTDTRVYHTPSCLWAQMILPENQIGFSSPGEAIANGYRPCENCNPPTALSRA